MKLQSKRIQGDNDGPHLLITGGVHGDEFEPMVAIRRLMKTVSASQLRGTVTLVPVVNEAAFMHGQRTAEDGLDLARICPGDPNGSVTEQVGHALSELIRTSDYYIDLHTGGNIMDVFPLSGYSLVANQETLDVQRRMAKAFNLPFVWGTNGTLDGRSLSVARDANVPAIYAEYLGSGLCHPEGVQDYFDGCLNVMRELGMMDHEQPASRVQYVVEDNRPNAGYLQIRNPAPINGLFEPQVELGGHVEAGQPLGTVSDVLGDQVMTVPSDATGLVVCLRSFSRVLQDDALAVVVDTGD